MKKAGKKERKKQVSQANKAWVPAKQTLQTLHGAWTKKNGSPRRIREEAEGDPDQKTGKAL